MPKDSHGISYPQNIPSTRISSYTKVTEDNKKKILTLGRILWIISENSVGSGFVICGCFPIRPKMEKGKTLAASGDPHVKLDQYQTFFPFEESLEDYRSNFNSVINKGITDGTLYIKNNDKLVKYKYV